MDAVIKVFVTGLVLHGINGFVFYDEIAQGTCTALLSGDAGGYVSAVKRECTSTSNTTCEHVCRGLSKFCINSLFIYSTNKAYKYDDCSSQGCGPNFCCCTDSTPAASVGYKQQIAQATCTALFSRRDYVSAVSRECSADTADCDTICKDLRKVCFESLHIYDKVALYPEITGKVGLQTYKYKDCSVGNCGPNFCCCSGD